MHTTDDLRHSDLPIRLDDEPITVPGLLTGFTEHDRLGVIVRSDGGGAGAGLLILAAVTAFYDIQRGKSSSFFIYPDYFVFHVDRPRGDHAMLDVWPGHKEVVVEYRPESIMQAVNDRGITRLAIEDGALQRAVELEPETEASARSRILTAVAFAANGEVRDGDVTITGNAAAERYIRQVSDASEAAGRFSTRQDGLLAEAHRRIDLDEAFGLLACSTGNPS